MEIQKKSLTLPFGEVPYKKYKRSFLQHVIVVLRFDKISSTNAIQKEWANFCASNFGPSSVENPLDNPVQITSKDGSLSFAFSNGMVGTKINARAYSNFADTIIPQVFKLRLFLEKVVGSDTMIKEIMIRKVNVWQIDTNEDFNQIVNNLNETFFSQRYLTYNENVDHSSENEDFLINNRKHIWSDALNTFIVSSGWIKDKEYANIYRLLLRTEYVKKTVNGVKLSDVEASMISMNTELFNAFEWIVSDKVKEMMGG